MGDISYEFIKEYGAFSEGKWPKQVNLISWNGKEPKYDIRPWDEGHEQMGKGITLTQEELYALGELIAKIRSEEGEPE